MKSQRRNLNPTPEAVAAMHLWGEDYSKQGGGSMDFYDALSQRKKDYCADMVKRILDANKNHAKART